MSCYGSDGDSSPHVPRKSMLAKEVLSMMRGLTSLNILEKRMKLLKKKKKNVCKKIEKKKKGKVEGVRIIGLKQTRKRGKYPSWVHLSF